MSKPFARHWLMLQKTPKKPNRITSAEMQEHLAEHGHRVSRRTVERDFVEFASMDELSVEHVDAEGERPAGWQYYGSDMFGFARMDTEVALSFAMVSLFLEPLLPNSIFNHLKPHIKQAKNKLDKESTSGQVNWRNWLKKIRIVRRGQQLLPHRVSQDIVNTVYEALFKNKQLEMKYQSKTNPEPSNYVVNPLGLVFRNATVYIVITNKGETKIKTFVLHRIKQVNICQSPAHSPKDFNLDSYIKEGEFQYKITEKPIKLKVLFSKDSAYHLSETRLSEDQLINDYDDERVLLECTVIDTMELRWWLMAFGDGVEVLKPQKLRDYFASIANNLKNNYSTAT